ncbi:MAG: type I methionyl aminopeptidase [Oscillospiraceae bacterium]|nr:type I methionyl aminopeptidase [Oscillospiraceae bacterium]
MIILKTSHDLKIMSEAGRISAMALELGGKMIRPGVSTAQVNRAIERFIRSQDAVPSFLGYGGFPASACISVNDEVIHGIPGGRILAEGDIVSIDVGAFYRGFHGDNAATFPVGNISAENQKLLGITRECLSLALEKAVMGNRIGDISHAVQLHAERHGLGVVRDYVGHGIGSKMHESPEVPNFGRPGRGPRLQAGMTLAIEPMINLGTGDVLIQDDDWTVVTKDGAPSAHFEHTVVITPDGPPVILTALWGCQWKEL